MAHFFRPVIKEILRVTRPLINMMFILAYGHIVWPCIIGEMDPMKFAFEGLYSFGVFVFANPYFQSQFFCICALMFLTIWGGWDVDGYPRRHRKGWIDWYWITLEGALTFSRWFKVSVANPTCHANALPLETLVRCGHAGQNTASCQSNSTRFC